MASLLNLILGDASGTDPLDQYLSSVGVSPSKPPVMVPPSALQQDAVPATPTAAQEAPQTVAPPVQEGPPVEVLGDRWKPKKVTTLGAIADILLARPIFHNKAKQESIKSAFQGFTEDPLRTIRRVAQVSPNAAWEMYNVYHDNNIQDQQQQRLKDSTTFDRGIGLLSVATPQNYSAIKQRVQKYWAAQGFNPGIDLPEEYDPEALQGIREAGMSAKDQLTYENTADYRQQRLEQFDKDVTSKISSRQADDARADRSTNSLLEYRQARLAQQGQGVTERERHNRAIEGNNNVQPITLPDGSVGMYDKKKGYMSRIVDGKEYHYAPIGRTGNQVHWRLLPEKAPEEE